MQDLGGKNLEVHIKACFGEQYKYGVKTMIDENKGVYYFKVMPYESRLNEFILTEMVKHGRKWVMYNNDIWTTDI